MTGNTLNQPSGSEPVTATAVGGLLTRLAKAGVASVFGMPDHSFGVLGAVIARLGPGHVGKSRLAMGATGHRLRPEFPGRARFCGPATLYRKPPLQFSSAWS